MRLDHIFLLSFLSSLVLQGFYWQVFDVLDQSQWIAATESLMTLTPGMFDPFTYGYPGAPPMAVAIGVHKVFDVPLPQAYTGSIAIIMSLIAAVAAVLCELIRPRHWWWLTSMVTLSSHTLYREATPPSVIVIPLITLLILISFYIHENHPVRHKWPFILLGMVTGVAAASRLDIAIFVALWQALLLWSAIGGLAVIFTLAVAMGTFFISNPFMWFFPLHHVLSFIQKLSYHYSERSVQLFRIGSFIEKSFFAWLGILYGFIFFLLPKKNRGVSTWIILNLFLVTGSLGAILFSSAYRPVWYFFPLLVLWEVFFMFFVLELISTLKKPLLLRLRSLPPNISVQLLVAIMFIMVRLGLLLLITRFPAFFIT